MFNRGFNGKPVQVNGGMRMGPVAFNPPAGAPAPSPLISGAAAAAPAKPGAQVKAPCGQPPAPAGKPGSVPVGGKGDCPVCRTFGK